MRMHLGGDGQNCRLVFKYTNRLQRVTVVTSRATNNGSPWEDIVKNVFRFNLFMVKKQVGLCSLNPGYRIYLRTLAWKLTRGAYVTYAPLSVPQIAVRRPSGRQVILGKELPVPKDLALRQVICEPEPVAQVKPVGRYIPPALRARPLVDPDAYHPGRIHIGQQDPMSLDLEKRNPYSRPEMNLSGHVLVSAEDTCRRVYDRNWPQTGWTSYPPRLIPPDGWNRVEVIDYITFVLTCRNVSARYDCLTLEESGVWERACELGLVDIFRSLLRYHVCSDERRTLYHPAN